MKVNNLTSEGNKNVIFSPGNKNKVKVALCLQFPDLSNLNHFFFPFPFTLFYYLQCFKFCSGFFFLTLFNFFKLEINQFVNYLIKNEK